MRESRALKCGMAEKRINPRLTASRRWQVSSWRGTDGMRVGDRIPRRISRPQLVRVSVTEVELRGGLFPRRLEMEKERRLRSINARAAIVASAAVGQEWTYIKTRLYRQVHYFRVRRNPPGIAGRRDDRFLQAEISGVIPLYRCSCVQCDSGPSAFVPSGLSRTQHSVFARTISSIRGNQPRLLF